MIAEAAEVLRFLRRVVLRFAVFLFAVFLFAVFLFAVLRLAVFLLAVFFLAVLRFAVFLFAVFLFAVLRFAVLRVAFLAVFLLAVFLFVVFLAVFRLAFFTAFLAAFFLRFTIFSSLVEQIARASLIFANSAVSPALCICFILSNIYFFTNNYKQAQLIKHIHKKHENGKLASQRALEAVFKSKKI